MDTHGNRLSPIHDITRFIAILWRLSSLQKCATCCFYATNFIKRQLKIDDSLDVFPVHGVGGILGTLLAGVFASPALGVFSGYGFANGIHTMSQCH